MGKIVTFVGLAVLAGLIAVNAPDIKRYIKISRM